METCDTSIDPCPPFILDTSLGKKVAWHYAKRIKLTI